MAEGQKHEQGPLPERWGKGFSNEHSISSSISWFPVKDIDLVAMVSRVISRVSTRWQKNMFLWGSYWMAAVPSPRALTSPTCWTGLLGSRVGHGCMGSEGLCCFLLGCSSLLQLGCCPGDEKIWSFLHLTPLLVLLPPRLAFASWPLLFPLTSAQQFTQALGILQQLKSLYLGSAKMNWVQKSCLFVS